MPFGSVDYTQLNRLSAGLAGINQGFLRNDVAANQMAIQQQDKEIANQAAREFYAATQPRTLQLPSPLEQRPEVYGTGPGGTKTDLGAMQGPLPGELAGPTPGPTVTVEPKPEDYLRAAQGSLAKLSMSGGPYSKAVAANIEGFVKNKIEMTPKPKQFAEQYKLVDVLDQQGNPQIINKEGALYRKQHYIDLASGQHVPNSETYTPHNPPSAGGAYWMNPAHSLSGYTEYDEEGKLRVKRNPDGTPAIKMDQGTLQREAGRISDDARAKQTHIDQLTKDRGTADYEAGLFESMVTDKEKEIKAAGQDPNADPDYQRFAQMAKDKRGKVNEYDKAIKTESADLDANENSLLRDIRVYAPGKAYGTGGRTWQAPSKGYGSRVGKGKGYASKIASAGK